MRSSLGSNLVLFLKENEKYFLKKIFKRFTVGKKQTKPQINQPIFAIM